MRGQRNLIEHLAGWQADAIIAIDAAGIGGSRDGLAQGQGREDDPKGRAELVLDGRTGTACVLQCVPLCERQAGDAQDHERVFRVGGEIVHRVNSFHRRVSGSGQTLVSGMVVSTRRQAGKTRKPIQRPASR